MNEYTPTELTPREILDTFMPECLPAIKRNITLLKKRKKEVEKICSPMLDATLEGIYMDTTMSEMARNLAFIPIAKFYFYSRHIDPIEEKILELEKLLKMIQVQSIGTPTPYLDLAKAKKYPIKNLIKVNHAGFAVCPFHREKTPSLKISKGNRFHCFGCGKDGDAVDFIMQRDGVNFQTAVYSLNNF